MFNLTGLYHWLAKFPIWLLFYLLIDRRITVKNIAEGLYGTSNLYYEKYDSLELAKWGYSLAKDRQNLLITKLIALTQIHGITFAVVSLAGNTDIFQSKVFTTIGLTCNLISILLVIFSLSIKKSLEPEISKLNDSKSFSNEMESEFNDVVGHTQDRCDFLADMFKLSQGFLVISIMISLLVVLDPFDWKESGRDLSVQEIPAAISTHKINEFQPMVDKLRVIGNSGQNENLKTHKKELQIRNHLP